MADPSDITLERIAVALRLSPDDDSVPPPVAQVLEIHRATGDELIETYAPGAPVPVKNGALVRVVGWLFDSDPASSIGLGALDASGAAALLTRFRVHQAQALSDGGVSPSPSPTPGSGLPPIPAEGTFILGVANGELEWVSFPLSS
ncbi:MAG: hypothetical protein F4Y04_03715 [Chloroflexi bacterium]|nr:hypothetical protein [Chloroflexota bacterium]